MIATVVFVAVLLVPAVRSGDGVPLSSYPMYASPRSAVVHFVVPVAIAADGTEQRLSTGLIAETADPLVAESYLRDEVAQGRAAELCKEIAARVSERGIVVVEIREQRHHVVDHALGRPSLVGSDLAARCELS